jgi:hypothetical protein
MRCPHCAGEILDGSRFCGICGRRLAAATIPAGGVVAGQPGPVAGAPPVRSRPALVPVPEAGMAPIELPISRGARWARIAAVLALDVALAGAGVAMILGFARDCEGLRGTSPAAAAPAASATTGGERGTDEVRP